MLFPDQILKRHWTGWTMQDHAVSFVMTADHIEGSLTEYNGRGWSASVVGINRVGGSLCCVYVVSSWLSVLILHEMLYHLC